jgi:hypothetical protein
VLNFVLSLHRSVAVLVLVLGALALIAGIASIVLTRRANGAAPSTGGSALTLRAFRILIWVTAGCGVLQAIIGGIVWLQGQRPGEGLHYVYGLIVLAAVPVAYVYSDQKDVRRDIIIMTIAAAAVVGAALRAFATG